METEKRDWLGNIKGAIKNRVSVKPPSNPQLIFRKKKDSKSSGVGKNSLTSLQCRFGGIGGPRFLGAGGQGNFSGILDPLAVGVLKLTSSSSPLSLSLGFVLIWLSCVRVDIPAITHLFPSDSRPPSTWGFPEKPIFPAPRYPKQRLLNWNKVIGSENGWGKGGFWAKVSEETRNKESDRKGSLIPSLMRFFRGRKDEKWTERLS